MYTSCSLLTPRQAKIGVKAWLNGQALVNVSVDADAYLNEPV